MDRDSVLPLFAARLHLSCEGIIWRLKLEKPCFIVVIDILTLISGDDLFDLGNCLLRARNIGRRGFTALLVLFNLVPLLEQFELAV